MSDDLKCPKCGAKRAVRCDGAVLAHYECGSHIDDGVISWQSDTCKIRERDATIAGLRETVRRWERLYAMQNDA